MTESKTSHPLSLESLQLPEPPGFWPLAWGWWSLIGTIILTIIALYLFWRWQKKRQAAKKAAIALLNLEKSTISPSGAMEIVRQAALSYYPRAKVAHLSGSSWLAFLDTQVKQPLFAPDVEEWLSALYEDKNVKDRDKLIDQCLIWLDTALPPKRGGR